MLQVHEPRPRGRRRLLKPLSPLLPLILAILLAGCGAPPTPPEPLRGFTASYATADGLVHNLTLSGPVDTLDAHGNPRPAYVLAIASPGASPTHYFLDGDLLVVRVDQTCPPQSPDCRGRLETSYRMARSLPPAGIGYHHLAHRDGLTVTTRGAPEPALLRDAHEGGRHLVALDGPPSPFPVPAETEHRDGELAPLRIADAPRLSFQQGAALPPIPAWPDPPLLPLAPVALPPDEQPVAGGLPWRALVPTDGAGCAVDWTAYAPRQEGGAWVQDSVTTWAGDRPYDHFRRADVATGRSLADNATSLDFTFPCADARAPQPVLGVREAEAQARARFPGLGALLLARVSVVPPDHGLPTERDPRTGWLHADLRFLSPRPAGLEQPFQVTVNLATGAIESAVVPASA